MVSALVSGSSAPGSSHDRGHCAVFLGKTLHFQCLSQLSCIKKTCEHAKSRFDHETSTHILFKLVNKRHHALIIKPRLTFYSNL